jgi:hypothetical protein
MKRLKVKRLEKRRMLCIGDWMMEWLWVKIM